MSLKSATSVPAANDCSTTSTASDRCVFFIDPSPVSLGCLMCQRRRQHLNSAAHRGRKIDCPFCGTVYATASGLCHHLEYPACPQAPTLDRDDVYRIVRLKDPRCLITKHLIGWHGSTTYKADSGAWNGSGFECSICHLVFSGLHRLNQHLSSPRREWRCFCPPHSSARPVSAWLTQNDAQTGSSCVIAQIASIVGSNSRPWRPS
jgi:hypothetical protein